MAASSGQMLTGLASLVVAGVLTGAAPQRVLVAGPVLAGPRVVWAEHAGGESILRAWPHQPPLWRSVTSSFSGDLAGSAAVIAFARSTEACPSQPGVACPVESETLAGPPRGSLQRLGAARRCSLGSGGQHLDVEGRRVASFDLDCGDGTARLSVWEPGSGAPRIVAREPAGGKSCCDLALAGRYVAWRSGAGVAVYDLTAGRRLYRVAAPGEAIAAFDVQADGKLALALVSGGRTAWLAWTAPGSPRLHRLGLPVTLPARGPAVRLAGDRIVFERPSSGATVQLAASDLRGRMRTLARFAGRVEQVGGFDADSTRVAWASRRITSTRVDCPPPGQGRPCVLRTAGVATVWLAPAAGGRPRSLARWALADAVG
ncbi:MAG: hypothetical protein ABR569_00165 [Gaiellaceae bacterium]